MNLHYHMLLLVVREPSLDRQHKPDDYLPPYSIRDDPSHAPNHIRDHCRKHATDLLECILSYDDQALREVPVIIYVRMMHSVVVLVKLDVSANPPIAFDIIRSLLHKLNRAAQDGRFLLPRTFNHVLQRLSDWNHSAGTDNRNPIQPLLGLDEARQPSGSPCLPGSTSSSSKAETSHTPEVFNGFEVDQGSQTEFDLQETGILSMPFLDPIGGAGFFDFMDLGYTCPTNNVGDWPFENHETE